MAAPGCAANGYRRDQNPCQRDPVAAPVSGACSINRTFS